MVNLSSVLLSNCLEGVMLRTSQLNTEQEEIWKNWAGSMWETWNKQSHMAQGGSWSHWIFMQSRSPEVMQWEERHFGSTWCPLEVSH